MNLRKFGFALAGIILLGETAVVAADPITIEFGQSQQSKRMNTVGNVGFPVMGKTPDMSDFSIVECYTLSSGDRAGYLLSTSLPINTQSPSTVTQDTLDQACQRQYSCQCTAKIKPVFKK